MADYQLIQSGPTIQDAINKALEIQGLLDQEAAARQAADALLATKTELQSEIARAQAAEALLATITSLQNEIDRATGVEGTLQGLIDAIEAQIPTAASSSNQLADKDFVNSSIATASATFRGTFTTMADMQATTADENDYAFLQTTDTAGNTVYRRYKYSNGSWVFEYDLNNSSFTAAQWAAINSAITSALVEKLNALPTNADLNTVLGQKYVKPSGGIPKTDLASAVQTSLGKADTALQTHQDISGKADIEDLESGEIVVALAGDIADWEGSTALVPYAHGDMVDTSGGSISIRSDMPARFDGIAPTSNAFKATKLVATGINLLRQTSQTGGIATTLGTGAYFPCPALTFGTYGTAAENNGLLFTNASGEFLQPTVYMKDIESGVPTSINDGVAAQVVTGANGEKFYVNPTSLAGKAVYVIVSGITLSSSCAHIAWSGTGVAYNYYISPTAASDAGIEVSLTAALNAVDNNGYLTICGQERDRLIYESDTLLRWVKANGRVVPTWATVEDSDNVGTYIHSATISGMATGGAARLEDGTELSVNGVVVSYADQSSTATSQAVIYNLVAQTTGTTAATMRVTVQDFGLVLLLGTEGTAELTIAYAQTVKDIARAFFMGGKDDDYRVIAEALAGLNVRLAAIEENYGKFGDIIAGSIDVTTVTRYLYPDVLEQDGAPSASIRPTNIRADLPWDGIPVYPGQRLHDNTNKKVYEAFWPCTAISNWICLNPD